MKIPSKIIADAKNRLIKTYDPLKIYLFGSFAWGKPTNESDLDLLVVVEKSKEKSYKRSRKGDLALSGVMIPWDLIIYTKDEFDTWAKHVSTLCYKIKKEGRLLYAKKKKDGVASCR